MLTFYIHKGDIIPPLDATLINVAGTYNPATNVSSVIFCVPNNKKPGFLIEKQASILDIPTSKVRYTWSQSDLNNLIIGTYMAYFTITYLDNSKRTYPNDGEFVQIIVT